MLTEGSIHTGFGHVTRCLSLINAFETQKSEVVFVIDGDESVVPMLNNCDYRLINWLGNFDKLADLFPVPDILIIDSYKATLQIYNQLSNWTKLSVYFDDNNRLSYPPGMIINGSVGADFIKYPKSELYNYVIGLKYIPLRKEFWKVPEKKINDTIKSVLLTFGGNDFRSLSVSVLKILTKSFPELQKRVIVGSAVLNQNKIESVADNKTELFFSPESSKIRDLMLDSDIAISTAGQTLYELAVCGTPAVVIMAVDNQKENIQGWEQHGSILYIGKWDEITDLKILNAIEQLSDKKKRQKISNDNKILIDGDGAKNIAEAILRTFYEQTISLRRAITTDMENIFELANDSVVRYNSLDSKPIPWENHVQWFSRKISDPASVFLIAESVNFVGQVRFDIDGDSALVNISISNDYRGMGIGKLVLKKGIDFIQENYASQVKNLIAYVKKENLASLNIFLSNKFVHMDPDDRETEVFKLIYLYV